MEGYSVTEAASVLGVPTERVWELLARGVLSGAPEGETGMRVFLQPRPAPPAVDEQPRPNGHENPREADPEASPFRELLTEFRNLTERYGQALLALGEARGEVASLRSRVDVLEARMDLRLPMSGPMPAPSTWGAPAVTGRDQVHSAQDRVAQPETGTDARLPQPPPPRDEETQQPVPPAAAGEERAVERDGEVEPSARRKRGRGHFREEFAEALARAEDPSPAVLPPGTVEPGASVASIRYEVPAHEDAAPAAPAASESPEALLPRELPAAEPMTIAEPDLEPRPASMPVVEPRTTEPEPAPEPIIAPMTTAELEPDSEPAAGPEAEPIAEVALEHAPEPETEPEPVAFAELQAIPEPVAFAEPQAIPEPVAFADPEAIPEPVAAPEAEPVVEAEPASSAEPDHAFDSELELPPEPDPVAALALEPEPGREPGPVAVAEPQPALEPEPVTVAESEPEPKPVWERESARESAPDAGLEPQPAPIREPKPEPDSAVLAESQAGEVASDDEPTWDQNRYSAEIEAPDWWTPEPSVAAEPDVAPAQRAAEAESSTPSLVEDEAPAAAIADASSPAVESRPGPMIELEPDATAPDAYRGEETMLWFGRRPQEPGSADWPSEDAAGEMEVASTGRRAPAEPDAAGSMPGADELHEALAALDASDPRRQPASGGAADAQRPPAAPASSGPPAAPTPPAELNSSAQRAYRRLRRIFPG